ncbi:MAG: DUF1573 domain-containing protein [Bacteroidales bacterium]|jgi:hypothetical protein
MKRFLILPGITSIAILLAVSCNNGSQSNIPGDVVKNPNTADGNGDTSNLPRFKFTEEQHDFGKIIQGEKVSYSFKFKNIGKSDLVITDAHGSCGCTIADYPKTPIPANGEGTIDVKFNSEGKKGFQSKTVTLIANTQPNTKVLSIKAMVQVPEDANKTDN